MGLSARCSLAGTRRPPSWWMIEWIFYRLYPTVTNDPEEFRIPTLMLCQWAFEDMITNQSSTATLRSIHHLDLFHPHPINWLAGAQRTRTVLWRSTANMLGAKNHCIESSNGRWKVLTNEPSPFCSFPWDVTLRLTEYSQECLGIESKKKRRYFIVSFPLNPEYCRSIDYRDHREYFLFSLDVSSDVTDCLYWCSCSFPSLQ